MRLVEMMLLLSLYQELGHGWWSRPQRQWEMLARRWRWRWNNRNPCRQLIILTKNSELNCVSFISSSHTRSNRTTLNIEQRTLTSGIDIHRLTAGISKIVQLNFLLGWRWRVTRYRAGLGILQSLIASKPGILEYGRRKVHFRHFTRLLISVFVACCSVIERDTSMERVERTTANPHSQPPLN